MHNSLFIFSMKLVASSAQCLKMVLSTQSGLNFLSIFDLGDGNPRLMLYLEPFKPRKKKVGCFFSVLFTYY